MVQQWEHCLSVVLSEIVVAVQMPPTRGRTKRPRNLYCRLVLTLGAVCVA
jgi:hypothetical protein